MDNIKLDNRQQITTWINKTFKLAKDKTLNIIIELANDYTLKQVTITPETQLQLNRANHKAVVEVIKDSKTIDNLTM